MCFVRSGDGRILAISSRDGYCSLVTFDNNELGVPYGQSASQVIENVRKESSPARRNAETVRSETPGTHIENRMYCNISLDRLKKTSKD